MTSARVIGSAIGPLRCRPRKSSGAGGLARKNSDMNVPTMNTSPWAKLMSSMMP